MTYRILIFFPWRIRRNTWLNIERFLWNLWHDVGIFPWTQLRRFYWLFYQRRFITFSIVNVHIWLRNLYFGFISIFLLRRRWFLLHEDISDFRNIITEHNLFFWFFWIFHWYASKCFIWKSLWLMYWFRGISLFFEDSISWSYCRFMVIILFSDRGILWKFVVKRR